MTKREFITRLALRKLSDYLADDMPPVAAKVLCHATAAADRLQDEDPCLFDLEDRYTLKAIDEAANERARIKRILKEKEEDRSK